VRVGEDERGRSLEERMAEELLESFGGFFASRRDGLVLVKLNVGGRTVMVWVRGSPITEKALRLYDKMVSKHDFDEAMLFKLRREADYVSFGELEKRFGRVVFSLKDLVRKEEAGGDL